MPFLCGTSVSHITWKCPVWADFMWDTLSVCMGSKSDLKSMHFWYKNHRLHLFFCAKSLMMKGWASIRVWTSIWMNTVVVFEWKSCIAQHRCTCIKKESCLQWPYRSYSGWLYDKSMWQEIRCIAIRIETRIVSKWKYRDTYRIGIQVTMCSTRYRLECTGSISFYIYYMIQCLP